ncbi:hypothetical protein E2C01_021961 [Portunus trituberculatus]|uniref:Uncharacterized protein n=1 Tax=Portunus trituberculatus TaxID=210409 RepID=A0A5B7E460_PORTR|nr:hypothetical protein [Portunus trituberculatus]
MEYSGPATRSQVEEDLALSDDEWPLPSHADHRAAVPGNEALSPEHMTSSVKRVLNTSSDSNDASTLPATKTAKQEEAPGVHGASDSLPAASTSVPRTPPLNSVPAQASPAFAPRDQATLAF